MRAIVCDICGKVVVNFPPHLEINKCHMVGINRYDTVDVCRDCLKEIMQLVKEKQNESSIGN